MVRPVYRASREVLARSACREHVVGVMNQFKSKKFTVARIPDWRKATFEGFGYCVDHDFVKATFEVEENETPTR